jgi:hypothetical protein
MTAVYGPCMFIFDKWVKKKTKNNYILVIATGWWFSQGTPGSSTNKTDFHDITEILLKVALNTINQSNMVHNNYPGNNYILVIFYIFLHK